MILIKVHDTYGREAWINPEHIVSLSPTTFTDGGEPATFAIIMYSQVIAYYVDRDGIMAQYPAMFHGGLTDDGSFVSTHIARCPYCFTDVYGTADNIDSGLRKHIDTCESAPDDGQGQI